RCRCRRVLHRRMGGPRAALGASGHRRLRLDLERRADRARRRHRLRRAPARPLRARPPRRPRVGRGPPVATIGPRAVAAAGPSPDRAYNGAMIRNIAAYHFAGIDDPPMLAARVRDWAGAAGLLGTVLVAPEGINLFLAGTDAGIDGFLGQLRGDPRLAAILVKDS